MRELILISINKVICLYQGSYPTISRIIGNKDKDIWMETYHRTAVIETERLWLDGYWVDTTTEERDFFQHLLQPLKG